MMVTYTPWSPTRTYTIDVVPPMTRGAEVWGGWWVAITRWPVDGRPDGWGFRLDDVTDKVSARLSALHLILNSPDPFLAELRRWWWAGAKRPEGVS